MLLIIKLVKHEYIYSHFLDVFRRTFTNQLVKNNNKNVSHNKISSNYLIKIAKLGGYLARASEPPPGNIVMRRGSSRLTDNININFASSNTSIPWI